MTIRILAGRTARAPFSIALALGAALAPGGASAQNATALPPISVEADDQGPLAVDGATASGAALGASTLFSTDSAQLLRRINGVETATGGGVSGLPVIRGLAEDRNKILVDGVPITAACPNKMNPATSYIDPARVARVDVIAGITPVSQGGDSIGGSISISSAPPVFAGGDETVHLEGKLSTYYRSNNRAIGGSVSGTAATENVSLGYTGSGVRARDYHDGNGDRVLASSYASTNHAATLAFQVDGNLVTIEGGQQFIPYEGFPNQWMDLLWNRSRHLNSSYKGSFAWGNLETRVYWRETDHYMNFLPEKSSGSMPMYTNGQDIGYQVKGEIVLSATDTLRVGNELHRATLDDWWPPVGSGMMAPNTLVNLNDATRDVLGTYVEWEKSLSRAWTTQLGLRNDTVWMNTGTVQGYNMMGYGADAAAFNAADRSKTDVNFGLTALARYEPAKTETYEFGVARKVRSPNFYERYAWSTGAMASSMVNWSGDGNGYVGNLDLKPETAYTASVSAGWHDADRADWSVKVTPHVSYVADYIDVDKVGNLTNMMGMPTGYSLFRFANRDALLYGVDLSGTKRLLEDPAYGRFDLKGDLAWTHGERIGDGDGLYRIMPLKVTAALEHRLGGWNNAVETELVAKATNVSSLRDQPKTPGYALVNLRSSYDFGTVRFDLGIENLFDHQYYLPLGGSDLTQDTVGRPLAGLGRSYNAGVTVSF